MHSVGTFALKHTRHIRNLLSLGLYRLTPFIFWQKVPPVHPSTTIPIVAMLRNDHCSHHVVTHQVMYARPSAREFVDVLLPCMHVAESLATAGLVETRNGVLIEICFRPQSVHNVHS